MVGTTPFALGTPRVPNTIPLPEGDDAMDATTNTGDLNVTQSASPGPAKRPRIEDEDRVHELAHQEDKDQLERRFQDIDKRINTEVGLLKKDIGAMTGKIEDLHEANKALPAQAPVQAWEPKKTSKEMPIPDGRMEKGARY